MPARLVSSNGHPDIPLDRVLVVVGRHYKCTVRIESIRVSRHHCCLALDGDTVLVGDLGSTNGTWINGRRVQEGVLRPGDELAIAHLRYRLEIRWPDGMAPTPLGRWLHGAETLPLPDLDAASGSAAPSPELIPWEPPPDAAQRWRCDGNPE